jgi:hypothetical protein
MMRNALICFTFLLWTVPISEAETREEFLAGVAEKAETLRGDALDNLIDSALQAGDVDQIRILVEHPQTFGDLVMRFSRMEPSKTADHLLIALITRPWPLDRGQPGSNSFRNVAVGDDFITYAAYMQKRLGHAIVEPTSEEQLLKPASRLEERMIVAREFERELVKAGLMSAEERTIPDPSATPTTPGPRKDPASAPAPPFRDESAATKAKERSGQLAAKWIAAVAVLILAIAAWIAFRRKSAAA